MTFALALALLVPTGIRAQDIDPPQVTRQAAEVRASSKLIEASRLATEDGVQRLRDVGFRVEAGDRLLVEIVGPLDSAPLPTRIVTDLGGEITGFYAGRTEALVPVAALESLARSVSNQHFVTPAGLGLRTHDFQGQGPTIMNSGAYRDDGFDGTGIRICVIDVGYSGLTSSEDSEDAPASYESYDYVGNGLKNPADGSHGRFVLETVYDHAPGATYVVMKVSTQVDVGQAVQDAIAEDVDIIVMSLGWWPSWGDDADAAAVAANAAGAAGILFMNSAGNEANEHYQGLFSDGDNDGVHSWNFGGDELLSVTIPPNTAVTFSLTFNPAGGNHDYDLFLTDSTGQQVFASSTFTGEVVESVSLSNPNAFSIPGNLVVQRIAGPGTTVEIYSSNATWNEHAVATGSTTVPSNASHANVLSIGAVEQAQYGSPKYSAGIIATYSSQGPTNGGAVVPDLCAPTSTSTSFSPSFTGTSCACPNAAGVAACLWSVNPTATAAQVRNLLYQWAAAGKDWGAPGFDTVYGRGGVHFPSYADCNMNQYPDAFDIASGGSSDVNSNGRPDECDGPGGYGFGWLSSQNPPIDGLKLLALITPSPLTLTAPAPITGFTWVFQYDPAVFHQFIVRPSPGLTAFLGAPPAVFDVTDTGAAIIVECTFALDPTGAPIEFTPLTQFEAGEYEYRLTATAGGSSTHGTFPLVNLPTAVNGLHTTTGLLLPAVQSGSVVQPVQPSHHRYQIREVGASLESSDLVVAYDPGAAQATVQALWSVGEAASGAEAVTALSMALAHDTAVLTSTAVDLYGDFAAQQPDVFLVNMGTSGLSVQVAWTTGVPPLTEFWGAGSSVVAVTYEAVPAALLGNTSGVITTLAFDGPTGLAAASNLVSGIGTSEEPVLQNGIVLLVPTVTAPTFRRGDLDADGQITIGDPINLLAYLFSGGTEPGCHDSADGNDDGTVSIADPITLLAYLFQSGTVPPAPGIGCGVDPTLDTLSCLNPGCQP